MSQVTRAQLSALAPQDPALVQALEELFRNNASGTVDIAALLLDGLQAKAAAAQLSARLDETNRRLENLEVAFRTDRACPTASEITFPPVQNPVGVSGTHKIGSHTVQFVNGVAVSVVP